MTQKLLLHLSLAEEKVMTESVVFCCKSITLSPEVGTGVSFSDAV